MTAAAESPGLRIASGLVLPVDVAGEAIAILAKRGAGKTNTGRVLAEELHGAKVQFVVLDPVGAWWGLRSSADGRKAGLPVPVLGGQHGDVPLQPAAGGLLADVVVDTGQSLVLDLSDFSKTEQRRFVVDLAERLYQRKARQPSLVHLLLEEADEFAPQGTGAAGRASETARMRGAIEQLVRRGRGRGIGLTMITQRSAVLNKDVLTQADVLLAMRTTGPQDVKAIEAWINRHADAGGHVVSSLPSLKTGEAWVWNPERGLLERVQIRLAHTFDSSRTPRAGEQRVEPRQLAPIDLAKLGADIEATAEKAKENDPAQLRRKVHALEQRARDAEQMLANIYELEQAQPERVEVPVLSEGELERLEQVAQGLAEYGVAIVSDLTARVDALREISDEILFQVRRVRAAESSTGDAAAARGAAAASRRVQTSAALASPAEGDRSRGARPNGGDVRPGRLSPGVGTQSVSAAPARSGDRDPRVSGPQQRILDALAALEAIGLADVPKTQLALFARASPKSSSFANNLGALRTAGLIDYPAGGRVCLTGEGRAIADAAGAPTASEELHRFVFGLIGRPKARLLEQLVAVYPASLEKEHLAELAAASATSSSFANNLGALRSLGLIDYPRPGEVAALPVLFLEERA